MAQLTIYMDESTMKKIERSARREKCSISKWVKNKIEGSFEEKWPKYFLEVLGSIQEHDLKRPKQPLLERDYKRESI